MAKKLNFAGILATIMGNRYAIHTENINIFQREQLILTNVSVKIDKGEFVYLVGRVGSGKSSFIKTLNAELPLIDGSALVAGFRLESIRNREIPLLRRKLGVVFQDFKLLTDRNVYKNLLFVLKATGWTEQKKMEERIDQILSEIGLPAVKNKMPHQLSGGEQQRVVVARALLNEPEILLADEPTGNLDTETSLEILELFNKIHRSGKTILMATHDRLIIDQFKHRTLICKDGKILEEEENQVDFKQIFADQK